MAAAGEAPASCSGGEMAALLGRCHGGWPLWGRGAAGGVPNTASAPLRGVGVAAGVRRRRADGETGMGGGGGGGGGGRGRSVGSGDSGVGGDGAWQRGG
ncbi:PE-PGRS family protein PE_PGRS33-like [Panicum virgatum]|uniref:PE-PGRS family protein PE_PGRS33-like n=1 Tax=Panicum virgatum TaxID=38727 RepID=UPI0019D520B7|nr:PE-PGRS family protein PE_PGRS33-like [Panicum virgatum]